MNPDFQKRSGFTLLELVICTAILGVLFTLFFPIIGPMRDRAEKVVCIGNLRSLHVSLSNYLIDQKHWPQVNEEWTDIQLEQGWKDFLAPYGATETVWICPSVKRAQAFDVQEGGESRRHLIHYMPAQFDEKPFSPVRYTTMPWVTEMFSPHGSGNILIRSDGAVWELNELLREAGQAPVF